MIKHYLKVALRNLLNYKAHSLISVICLAVGITCFSVANHFINSVTDNDELPNYEGRIELSLSSPQTAADFVRWLKEDVAYIEGLSLSGIDTLVASSFAEQAEVTVIDKNQQAFPFLIQYRCVSPSFFSYYNKKVENKDKKLVAPDEVVISRSFARKAFGKENPIGMIVHLETNYRHLPNQIKDYKIVNVVDDDKAESIDCYFPLSMNPRLKLSVNTYLAGQTTLENLNKLLDKITWKRGEMDLHVRAYSQAERKNDLQRNIGILFARFLASLILLSGLINFMKFVIQMFYNRQRELALRKCMGSDVKGMFLLLFTEVFWMLLAAFFLSLVITEIFLTLMYTYVPQEDMIQFPLADLYRLQFFLYIGLLAICSIVIIYPIYRLRRLSIIHHIVQKQKRHVFRNIMIGLQLAISIFFVGGSYGIVLSYNETWGKMYSPLNKDEEKQVISLSVNSLRMRQNIDAILSDIRSLSDITDQTGISEQFNLGSFTYMRYEKSGHPARGVLMMEGNPHYFDFFRIPMEGKKMDCNVKGAVYVSRKFKEQLQKDSIEGTVRLSGSDYQIAGTYEALYKEGAADQLNVSGSVFLVSPEVSIYYFKVIDSNRTPNAIKQITEICRRYVPGTLPLDIHCINDTKQTTIGIMQMVLGASMLLAVISVLLVILSVYSAISLDTMSRQKEVAIRKINGATPKTIALLFGRVYLIIYLAAFCTIYPLLRLMMASMLAGSGLKNIYRWDWGILLFLAMAFLIFCITAYKIYKVMHLNPASILKKE